MSHLIEINPNFETLVKFYTSKREMQVAILLVSEQSGETEPVPLNSRSVGGQ